MPNIILNKKGIQHLVNSLHSTVSILIKNNDNPSAEDYLRRSANEIAERSFLNERQFIEIVQRNAQVSSQDREVQTKRAVWRETAEMERQDYTIKKGNLLEHLKKCFAAAYEHQEQHGLNLT